jgi:hypothetical protein
MFSKMNGVRPSGATTTSVRSPPMKPKLVPAGVSIEYIYHIEDNPKIAESFLLKDYAAIVSLF